MIANNSVISVMLLVYLLTAVYKTFPPGSAHGSTQCTTLSIAVENQIFESSPIQTYTVTLISTQSRVTASGTTTVTVNDDDSKQSWC